MAGDASQAAGADVGAAGDQLCVCDSAGHGAGGAVWMSIGGAGWCIATNLGSCEEVHREPAGSSRQPRQHSSEIQFMANLSAPELETYSDKYQSAASAKDYEQRIYAAGGGSEALWKIEQQVMDRLLARYCPRHQEAEALDFACGSGRILKYLQARTKSLIGVDISAAMLELAQEKVGQGVKLICTDIVARPESIPGDRDLVTAFRFLLLAEAPLRAACIAELAKKVKAPGGVMI